jgi:hypothetical protein
MRFFVAKSRWTSREESNFSVTISSAQTQTLVPNELPNRRDILAIYYASRDKYRDITFERPAQQCADYLALNTQSKFWTQIMSFNVNSHTNNFYLSR